MTLRKVIKISGIDANNFLQNLISNDIREFNCAMYSCLLTAKGKYDFDFFVVRQNDSFLIDINAQQATRLLEVLNYRKLIAIVKLEILDNYAVLSNILLSNSDDINNIIDKGILFQDTRHQDLGARLIIENKYLVLLSEDKLALYNYNQESASYTELRYQNTIPEVGELVPNKTIPIEVGMDELGAISYSKGCYLGQEFTNSAKHKLAIRKRLISAVIHPLVQIGDKVYTEKNEEVGSVISVYKNYAFILFKMKYQDEKIIIKQDKITLLIPDWINIYTVE